MYNNYGRFEWRKMKLPLAYYGDPILRKKGSQIDTINDDIRQLVENMIDTMISTRGIGLAAPQVHHSLALFIAYFIDSEEEIDRSKIRIFINPKVISYSKETLKLSEGCLSIPKLYLDIDRPRSVTISALDLEGNIFTEEFHDFHAHIVLHENDHLNGVLFVDRLPVKERKSVDQFLRKLKKRSR